MTHASTLCKNEIEWSFSSVLLFKKKYEVIFVFCQIQYRYWTNIIVARLQRTLIFTFLNTS